MGLLHKFTIFLDLVAIKVAGRWWFLSKIVVIIIIAETLALNSGDDDGLQRRFLAWVSF